MGSRELQALLEFADAAGEGDADAVEEDDDVFVVEGGFDFADAVQAGEGGAVQPEKFLGRNLGFDGREGFAEDEILLARVHHDVVAGGFDPVEVGDFHEARAVAVADGEAGDVGGRRIGGGAGGGARFEEGEEARGGVVGGVFSRELVAGALEGSAKAGGFERFEEVVERVEFEGADGVGVEGGDEDDDGRFLLEFAEDGEAGHLGHLDVEEENVGEALAEGGESGAAVGALAEDLNVGLGGEEGADALAGERFVVDDQGGEFHAGAVAPTPRRSVQKGNTTSTRTPPAGGERRVRRARPAWRVRSRSSELARPMPRRAVGAERLSKLLELRGDACALAGLEAEALVCLAVHGRVLDRL